MRKSKTDAQLKAVLADLRKPVEEDKEFAALATAFKALRELDELAQQRAIQWLSGRFAADAYARCKAPPADGEGNGP